MPTVRNKAGLEKVFVDNLEELGSLSARTDIADSSTSVFLKASATGVLEVSDNSKITQGEGIITGGGDGLQQVLLYGKNGSNGNLEPLETVGDRLLVDVIELSPTGPHTPTSLPSVAIHGQVDATSGFKNLRVSSNGVLSTDKVLKSTESQTNTTMNISSNSEGSLEIDTTGFSKVRISGVSSTTDSLVLMCSSISGGTLMAFDSLIPVSTVYDSTGGTQNIFSKLIECPPTFIKIRNPTNSTISILSSNVKTIV